MSPVYDELIDLDKAKDDTYDQPDDAPSRPVSNVYQDVDGNNVPSRPASNVYQDPDGAAAAKPVPGPGTYIHPDLVQDTDAYIHPNPARDSDAYIHPNPSRDSEAYIHPNSAPDDSSDTYIHPNSSRDSDAFKQYDDLSKPLVTHI